MYLRMSILSRQSGRTWVAAALVALVAGCAPAQPSEVTLELTGNDEQKFSVERFETTAPAKVTIKLKNVGTMKMPAMGHNLVVLKRGVDPVEFGADCTSAGANAANGFLPESMRDKAIAWTKVLDAGGEDTIVVELPEAGRYAYVCTFSGHFLKMKGVIVAR